MKKLTNKDIARMVKRWLKGEPITKTAEFFQISRQRVHQIIRKFKETGEIPWKMIIAFMDDVSRSITCFGVFDEATTENTIKVLRRGFAEYGVPDEILTDHGIQFVPARNRGSASHKFKQFLAEHGVKHAVARIKHPQTNGKIERFFGEVERRAEKFGSVEAAVR